jgi:hypothetical protein
MVWVRYRGWGYVFRRLGAVKGAESVAEFNPPSHFPISAFLFHFPISLYVTFSFSLSYFVFLFFFRLLSHFTFLFRFPIFL